MTRLLPWLLLLAVIALPAAPPLSAQPLEPALLVLHKDRADGTYRLFNVIDNLPLGTPLVDCCNTIAGTLTFDPALREILLFQHTDSGDEVVRINAGTGAVTGRATVIGDWRILAAAYDRTRATLFAIGRNSAGDRHLLTVVPVSGAVSSVGAPLPAGFALVPGGHGLHPRRGQWHLLGSHDTAGDTQHVLTLSLSSGAPLSDTAVVGHVLSNLHFDEGSGRLLGLGRIDGQSQTQLLWLEPGSGQVTVLTSSGTDDCCQWSVGSLAAIASQGIAVSHFITPAQLPNFIVWEVGTGSALGLIPQTANWAIHGVVADQTVFIGDYLFYDGFQTVGKPASGLLPFE